MRKLIVSLITLGLLGSGAVYLTSCAKQAGPLSPSINTVGVSNSASKKMPHISLAFMPTSVSTTAQVYFDTPMDASSFVAGSTVAIYTPDNVNTTSESPYTAFSLSYNATSRTLSIIPNNNDWATNTWYHVVFTTGIRSASGNQLDGNQNDIAESNEFDKAEVQFSLGAPTNTNYNLNPLTIVDVNATDGGPSPTGDYWGNVNFYNYVTITIQFGESMTTTDNPYPVFTSATSLPSWMTFTDSNGAAVTPVSVGLVTTIETDDTLQIVLSLSANTRYIGKMQSGVNGPRSRGNSDVTLGRGRYVGSVENPQPDTMIIQTMAAAGPLPRVYVSNIAAEGLNSSAGGLRRFAVTFSVPTGNGELDASTVNASNFKVLTEAGQPIVLSAIELDRTSSISSIVYLYVPAHFMNASAGYKTVTVWVSHNVQSADGIKLDQNNDSVAGTTADDDSLEFLSTDASPKVYNF